MDERLQFWSSILSETLTVFDKQATMASPEYNRGTPLKITWNLRADFKCSSCVKCWDSTQVPIEMQYKVDRRRYRENSILDGKINIIENGQQCKNCNGEYEKPSFELGSAKRAGSKLNEKILEKYFGFTSFRSKHVNFDDAYEPRRAGHEKEYCEGCKKGVCSGTSSDTERGTSKHYSPYVRKRPAPNASTWKAATVSWKLMIDEQYCLLNKN